MLLGFLLFYCSLTLAGCLPNQGNQGNQGKIRELRVDLKISRKKSGKSAKSGENQGKIREIIYLQK